MNIMRVWSHALFNNCSHSLFNNYVLYLLYLNNHLLKKKKKVDYHLNRQVVSYWRLLIHLKKFFWTRNFRERKPKVFIDGINLE